MQLVKNRINNEIITLITKGELFLWSIPITWSNLIFFNLDRSKNTFLEPKIYKNNQIGNR